MKPHLNLVRELVGLTVIVAVPILMAADATTTTYPIYYPAKPYSPPEYSKPASMMASATNTASVALNAQALLLKEILQEHQSRAAELTQSNQSEKARWETELVNELQEKSARVQ